jgi:hypothetical protein
MRSAILRLIAELNDMQRASADGSRHAFFV